MQQILPQIINLYLAKHIRHNDSRCWAITKGQIRDTVLVLLLGSVDT